VLLLVGVVLLAAGLVLPPDAGMPRDLTRLAGLALVVLASFRLFVRR
jgi:hypothetical protein